MAKTNVVEEPVTAPLVADAPQEPPMADPRTTPELMTPEQRAAFALKERARILVANGQMTVQQALDQNLISQPDAVQMMHLTREELAAAPLGVIQAPVGPTVATEQRCC